MEDRTYVPVDNWRAGTVTPVFQRGDMEAVEVNCPQWPCTRTSRCPASQVPPSEVRPCRVAPASQAGSQGPPVAGRTVCNVVCVPSSHADGNSRGDHPLPLLGPSQAPPGTGPHQKALAAPQVGVELLERAEGESEARSELVILWPPIKL